MKYLKKIYYGLEFIVYYMIKLVQANVYVAYDILTPKILAKPAFLEVPVKLKSNLGILMFSNLLSMTPGTLSIDISKDKKRILVHVLYHSTDELMQKDFDAMQEKVRKITE